MSESPGFESIDLMCEHCSEDGCGAVTLVIETKPSEWKEGVLLSLSPFFFFFFNEQKIISQLVISKCLVNFFFLTNRDK